MSRFRFKREGQQVPDGVTEVTVDIAVVPAKAFSGKKSLKSVVLTDKVQAIGERAFEGCKSLKEVQFPDTGKFHIIGEDAFLSCKRLKDIEFPNGLELIGSSAFAQCSSLKKVYLPTSVEGIESFAFRDCKSLRLVIIPPGVAKIDQSTFYGCTKLTSVVLSEGTKVIDDFAFAFNSSLTIVELPQSHVKVEKHSFHKCEALEEKSAEGNVLEFVKHRFDGFPMHWILYQRHYTKSTDHVLEQLQKVYRKDPQTIQRKDVFGLSAMNILGMTTSPYSMIDDFQIFQWLNDPQDDSTINDSTRESVTTADNDESSINESETSFGRDNPSKTQPPSDPSEELREKAAKDLKLRKQFAKDLYDLYNNVNSGTPKPVSNDFRDITQEMPHSRDNQDKNFVGDTVENQGKDNQDRDNQDKDFVGDNVENQGKDNQDAKRKSEMLRKKYMHKMDNNPMLRNGASGMDGFNSIPKHAVEHKVSFGEDEINHYTDEPDKRGRSLYLKSKPFWHMEHPGRVKNNRHDDDSITDSISSSSSSSSSEDSSDY